MQKLILFFFILSYSIFPEWLVEKNQSKENMNSILISENETKTTGLIIISTNFDGNLSLVYVANLSLEKLEDTKIFEDFSYGYFRELNKYLAIKTIANGIVTIENTKEPELIKAMESFNKSNLNLTK